MEHLPKRLSEDTINHLLRSIGLPNAVKIITPNVTAQCRSIYVISIPPNEKSNPIELVLRVSGPHLPYMKTRNEVAVMTWVKQHTTIPVPDVIAYGDSDMNPIGHEYTLLSKASGRTVSDVYGMLTQDQIENILDQLAQYMVELQGGLELQDDGTIGVGRMVDETFWQVPDMKKFWPEGETVDSFNLRGPYPTYTDLIIGQVNTYIRLIQTHPKLTMMRNAVPPQAH
ncbi:hypothetical protein GQ44DRAFT_723813 [Phaeosphaeriaceae sp. PMI808]|nr:hypothetical protein GQ44DRAFT_723813 [Phaeosphaeriaceae sp. PMI808]